MASAINGRSCQKRIVDSPWKAIVSEPSPWPDWMCYQCGKSVFDLTESVRSNTRGFDVISHCHMDELEVTILAIKKDLPESSDLKSASDGDPLQ